METVNFLCKFIFRRVSRKLTHNTCIYVIIRTANLKIVFENQ